MFGAVVACLFEYVLGIRQQNDSAGYDKIVISPALSDELTFFDGYITTPRGRISVSFIRTDGGVEYKVQIPEGVTARIAIKGANEKTAGAGIHTINI